MINELMAIVAETEHKLRSFSYFPYSSFSFFSSSYQAIKDLKWKDKSIKMPQDPPISEVFDGL